MKSFFKGLLFGAGLGGSLGIFFAPKKGKELQNQIDQYVVDVTDSTKTFKNHVEEFQKNVKETSELVAQMIPTVSQAIQKDIDAFKFQAEPRIKRIEEQRTILSQHVQEAKQKFASTK